MSSSLIQSHVNGFFQYLKGKKQSVEMARDNTHIVLKNQKGVYLITFHAIEYLIAKDISTTTMLLIVVNQNNRKDESFEPFDNFADAFQKVQNAFSILSFKGICNISII